MSREADFKRQLQYKIFEVLTGIISASDENLIAKILGPEAMDKYWIPAFTHLTANPEYKKNYEIFEYIGDRFVHAAFTMYIEKLSQIRGVNLDPEERTLLLNDYMSEDFQAQKSEELGLVNFLIRSPDLELTKKIKGDVFESFFGALAVIAEELIYPGMSYVYTFNLMEKILQSVPIDFAKIQRPAVTQLKEIYDILYSAQEKPNYIYDRSDLIGYTNKATVRAPDGSVLGIGYGNDQDEAQRDAAKKSLTSLAQRGITKEILQK